MTRYASTVTPEQAPCTDCGVITDETDINDHESDLLGDWVCESCAVARREWRQERDYGDA